MSTYDFEPRHNEVSRHIASGVLNSGFVQIVKTLCQFGSVIIMSRLLLPSDFGLVAMTAPVVGFIALFQDLGINQATVQRPALGHDEVNAFFWINVAAGLVLAILLIAISPLVGWYYGEPRVVALNAAIGFQVFISGIGNQHSSILQRRMEFGALALIGVAGTVSGLVAAIIWALIFKNYWAIYFGSLVGTILPVICVWIASRWKPSVPKLVPGLGHMLKFGAGITGFNISNFIARNMDNVLIGRRWGDHELGLYDRAYKLLLFPLQRIIDPMWGVMIPVLSRLTEEPDRYRSIFLRGLSQLTLAAWPGIIWSIVLADTIIPNVLGKNWGNAIPMFVPLAIAGLLQVANGQTNWLFVSQGRSGDLARWGFVYAATCVAAFVIGLPYGAIGVAIAYAVSEYLRTPFLWWYVTRKGPIHLSQIIRAVLPQAIGAIISCLALMQAKYTIGRDNPRTLLVGGMILSYATTLLVTALFADGRQTLKETVTMSKRLLKHAVSKKENSA